MAGFASSLEADPEDKIFPDLAYYSASIMDC